MSEIKRIAIAVVREDDRFLVGKRPNDVPLGGYDEFPGGKVEPHESFGEAAVRECLEETGLRVRVEQTLLEKRHDYEHASLHLQFIECKLAQQDSLQVAPPFRWVERENLAKLRFPDANAELIEILTAD